MDTLAVRLTFPPVGYVKDLEALTSAPSSRCALPGAQRRKAASFEAAFFLYIENSLYRLTGLLNRNPQGVADPRG
jgi:hypothetical protein